MNRHRASLFVFTFTLAFAATAGGQFFLPPGVLNPGADSDGGEDLFASHVIGPDLTIHAVWFSQVDYTGDSGGDPDLFYSRLPPGGTWSAPELVNTYGRSDDGADERNPSLALDGAGGVHCVWQSQVSLGGAGSDWDIFYARRTSSGWQPAEPVNGAAYDDPINLPSDDVNPAIAVMGNGNVMVTWESNRALVPGPSDRDLVFKIRESSGWTTFGPVNDNAYTDSGDDLGPAAMATLADGDVVAVWSTDDDFRQGFPVGSDRDIVWSRYDPSSSWTVMEEVSELERLDSGDDRNPAVAVWGSGIEEELHVVWQSTEDLEYAGNDWDILYTVVAVNFVVLPAINPTFVVNRRASMDGTAADEEPSICVEPGGALHVVWQSTADPLGNVNTDLDVFHAVNGTPGREWSFEGLLGLNAFFDAATAVDWQPQIRCAANGVLSGIWASSDDLGGTVGTDFDVFHALGFGVGVTRPQSVPPWGRFDGTSDDDFDLALAVDSQNRLHAVWASRKSGDGAPSTGGDLDILYSVRDSSGWSAVELVNLSGYADTGHDDQPDIGVDAAGTVHVVWSSTENIGGSVGTDRDLFYAERPVNGGFTAPERVHDSATSDNFSPNDDADPTIAVGADGTVHVAWVSQQQLFSPQQGNISYASRSPAGSWSNEELVSGNNFDGYHEHPDVALVGGAPLVVWDSTASVFSTGADHDIFANLRRPQGFLVPGPIGNATSDSADDFLPSVAVTPSGTVHVVWSTTGAPAAGGDADLVHVSSSDGIQWSPVELLLSYGAGDSGGDSFPLVATDGQALHVVWNSTDGLTFGAAGSDYDVLYARIPLPATFPSSVPVGVADASAFGDFTREWVEALVLDSGGRPWFGWHRDGAFEAQFGADTDVLVARPMLVAPAAGAIFADGFESGDTSAWSSSTP